MSALLCIFAVALLPVAEPILPAKIEIPGVPPPRKKAEVEAALLGSSAPDTAKALRILLVAGPKDHGPGEHDYPLWQRRWLNILGEAENVMVSDAMGWPTPEQFAKADIVVINSANPGWRKERAADLDAFFARGGGLVLLHYGVNGGRAITDYAERVGLAWQGGKSKYRHGALDLQLPKKDHPITRNLSKVRFVDESYWNLAGDIKGIDILATAKEEGEERPLMWTKEVGKGRVFVSILGHYNWTFDDPLFRILILRGMLWTAGQNVDRFNPLATLGARVE